MISWHTSFFFFFFFDFRTIGVLRSSDTFQSISGADNKPIYLRFSWAASQAVYHLLVFIFSSIADNGHFCISERGRMDVDKNVTGRE